MRLIGLFTFIVLAALSVLLPASMPGELSPGEMTRHGATVCGACPPTEQLVAAGMQAGEESWYLNVRFAVPPFNARMRVSFAGVPGVIELHQMGKIWRFVRSISPASLL